jgi:hypothetical protein
MLVCEEEETFKEAAAALSGTGFAPVKPWSGAADCVVVVGCRAGAYEKAVEHGKRFDVPTLFARDVKCLERLLERVLPGAR